jgi:colanic acid/amylovoran biosynthesis glycosyltransferase
MTLSDDAPGGGTEVSSSMKIAYVVSLFPCWSETFILSEIRELRRRGANVTIFSLRSPSESLIQEEAAPFLGNVCYPSLRWSIPGVLRKLILRPNISLDIMATILKSMWRSPAMLAKTIAMIPRTLGFLDIIERSGITHIHAHWATYPATACWIMRSYSGIPYSFTAHAHDIWLEKPLLAEKIRSARFVVAISEYNRRYLEAYASNRKSIKLIPCGLDLSRFPYRKPVIPETPTLLAAGRFDEIKGFPHFIEACRILHDRGFPFRARIIGDGPLRQTLIGRVRASGLDNRVEVLPAMIHSQLLPEIGRSSLFIAPSVRTARGNQDGIPVVLMEALALGTPVIASRVSGIPELIADGRTGFLVPPGNPEALAEAILEACSDPIRLEEISLAGRKTVEERFNIAASVETLTHEIEAGSTGPEIRPGEDLGLETTADPLIPEVPVERTA